MEFIPLCLQEKFQNNIILYNFYIIYICNLYIYNFYIILPCYHISCVERIIRELLLSVRFPADWEPIIRVDSTAAPPVVLVETENVTEYTTDTSDK